MTDKPAPLLTPCHYVKYKLVGDTLKCPECSHTRKAPQTKPTGA